MSIQTIKEFFRSKTFFINLIISFVVVIFMLALVYKWLDSYTDHGNSVTVPDLKGMNIKQMEAFLRNKNLSFKIVDSTVFSLDKPHGTIVEQDPPADERVKEGRTLYLTITRSEAPIFKMPNLKDVSLRQAEAILNSYGLKMGQQIFKPDLAKNAVLSMMISGHEIKAGDDVSKGSVIDLIVGDGLGNTLVTVPDLVSLTYEEALFVLKGSSLNVGSVFYEGTIRDTMNAKVYSQHPSPQDSSINQGEAIDIYIRQ